ncbi:unnamed protein product [Amoebophrya sp. A120]|nr:unnamed protein product [Amoebophrya sp. A120]|eukprot:GSA120T00025145001.1
MRSGVLVATVAQPVLFVALVHLVALGRHGDVHGLAVPQFPEQPWKIKKDDASTGDACLVPPHKRQNNATTLEWPVCCLDHDALVRLYGRSDFYAACSSMAAVCCDRYRWREELVQKALNCEHGLVIGSEEERFWKLWKRQVLFATPADKSVAGKVLKRSDRRHCILGEFAASATSGTVLQMGVHRFQGKTSFRELDVYFHDLHYHLRVTEVIFAALWRSKSLTLYDLLLAGQWQLFSIIDGLAQTWSDTVLVGKEPAAFGWGPFGGIKPSEWNALRSTQQQLHSSQPQTVGFGPGSSCAVCRIHQWVSEKERRQDRTLISHISRALTRNDRISAQIFLDFAAPHTCDVDFLRSIFGGGNSTISQFTKKAIMWEWQADSRKQDESTTEYLPAPTKTFVACFRQATVHLAAAHSLLAHDAPTLLSVDVASGKQVQQDARRHIAKAQSFLERALETSSNPLSDLVLFGSPHAHKQWPTFPVLSLLSALGLAASALFLGARGLSQFFTVPFYDSVGNNVRVNGGQRPFCTDGLFIRLVDATPVFPDRDLAASEERASGDSPFVFVEVGAHQGDCIIHALRKFPDAQAVVFEPSKLAVAAFQRTVRANGWEKRVRVVQKMVVARRTAKKPDQKDGTADETTGDVTTTAGTTSEGASEIQVDARTPKIPKMRIPDAEDLHTIYLNPFSTAESYATSDSFFHTKRQKKVQDASACILRPDAQECDHYDVVRATTLSDWFTGPGRSLAAPAVAAPPVALTDAAVSTFAGAGEALTYLKIHCQGCELAALEGATELFHRRAVCIATAKLETMFEGLEPRAVGDKQRSTTDHVPQKAREASRFLLDLFVPNQYDLMIVSAPHEDFWDPTLSEDRLRRRVLRFNLHDGVTPRRDLETAVALELQRRSIYWQSWQAGDETADAANLSKAAEAILVAVPRYPRSRHCRALIQYFATKSDQE